MIAHGPFSGNGRPAGAADVGRTEDGTSFKLTADTIFKTGSGSGAGRDLVEGLHNAPRIVWRRRTVHLTTVPLSFSVKEGILTITNTQMGFHMTSVLIAHLGFVPMAVPFGNNQHTLVDAFNTRAMSGFGSA